MTRFRDHIDTTDDRQALTALAEAAFENAHELVEDARILLGCARYARVVFLSQIAGEELGKVVMCVSGIVDAALGNLDRKKFHSNYRHHLSKLKSIMAVDNLCLSNDFVGEMQELDEAAGDYDKGKMLSLYSGQFIGDDPVDAAVLLPRDVISEAMARNAFTMAEGRLRLINALDWVRLLKSTSDDELCRIKEDFEATLHQRNGEVVNDSGDD